MFTKQLLRFVKAKDSLKEIARDAKSVFDQVHPADKFIYMTGIGVGAGIVMGAATGLCEIGVALGKGETHVDEDFLPLPAHLILTAFVGGGFGGGAGATLGFIAAAPRITAAAACAVGAVAAITAAKNKM